MVVAMVRESGEGRWRGGGSFRVAFLDCVVLCCIELGWVRGIQGSSCSHNVWSDILKCSLAVIVRYICLVLCRAS
jgi:hypothetical protein